MRYLCNISYDGSSFYGSQKQKNKESILGNIEDALKVLLQSDISLVCVSRTDKGVHAINSYIQFDYDKEIEFDKFLYKINKSIDKAIYVKSIKKVNDDFHCRFNCIKKEYVYIINMGVYNPFERNYVYQYNKKIDVKIIKKFCKSLSGVHNFKTFTTEKYNNYERNVSIKYCIKDDYLYIYVSSNGFFKYMVRNIIGLLISINDNKLSINDIDKIINSESRNSLLKTIEPCGLYLRNVEFK